MERVAEGRMRRRQGCGHKPARNYKECKKNLYSTLHKSRYTNDLSGCVQIIFRNIFYTQVCNSKAGKPASGHTDLKKKPVI